VVCLTAQTPGDYSQDFCLESTDSAQLIFSIMSNLQILNHDPERWHLRSLVYP
jgi:hypothetical protein